MSKRALALAIGISLVWLFLVAADGAQSRAPGQLGVQPMDAWTCPASHPIKGQLHDIFG